jgi:hypothetical protein
MLLSGVATSTDTLKFPVIIVITVSEGAPTDAEALKTMDESAHGATGFGQEMGPSVVIGKDHFPPPGGSGPSAQGQPVNVVVTRSIREKLLEAVPLLHPSSTIPHEGPQEVAKESL